MKYSDWLILNRGEIKPQVSDKIVGDLAMYENNEFEIIKTVLPDNMFIVEYNEPQNMIHNINGWYAEIDSNEFRTT